MAEVIQGRWGDKRDGPGNTGGGNPPGDSQLEGRVATLEKASQDIRDRLVRIEAKLESMESHSASSADIAVLATKDDLNNLVRASSKDIQDLAVTFQKSINDQTWKFIGVAAALATIAFTAAKFIN
ncbi:hypothetical protein [Pseudomonas capsici]|uniref:hypothetical protein n=1 Tax=Pseudomonas capsici TaxID=2810614 RepID=UPI0021F0AF25|nr:hypothetical protein [Pseudomonas capsici]MCV4343260.1 hypothetical protein [Pseudomonas capsici]